MKTVVFAYHDIGCTGIRALLAQGFEITSLFTHPDETGENHFLSRLPNWPPSIILRSTARRILTTRYG